MTRGGVRLRLVALRAPGPRSSGSSRRAKILRRVIAGIATLAFSVFASAADSPRSALDDAKILARSGALVEAAAQFGAAAAVAQRAGDLVAENEAADAFALFVARETAAASLPDDEDARLRPERLRASLLAAAMGRMDAERCGAFVSAPVLARYVLQSATETGDFRHVPAAEKVAALHRERRGSGRGAATTARYATGMKLVAAERWKDATEPLRAAFDESVAAGWFDLAMHAGTELAIAWWRAGDEAEAKRVLTSVGAVLELPRPPRFFRQWVFIVEARFPDAGHPLRKLLDGKRGAAGRYSGSEGGYGSGGGVVRAQGGRGGVAGKEFDNTSEIGALLRVLPASGRIATVTRTEEGFEIDWATEAGHAPARKLDERVLHAVAGGVTLTFQSTSVALRRVDVEGTAGEPESSSDPREPDPARAFYLLARDEVWIVGRDGRVTISDR